jgi:hypothetical protein
LIELGSTPTAQLGGNDGNATRDQRGRYHRPVDKAIVPLRAMDLDSLMAVWRSHASVMRAYRDFIATAPEELGIFVGLKSVPSVDPFPRDYWGRRACAITGAYNGPADEGAKLMGAAARRGVTALLLSASGCS